MLPDQFREFLKFLPTDVKLLAVSKGHSASSIRELAEFESQVMELMDQAGYERDVCVAALEDANGDETDAINWLLSCRIDI